MVGTCPSSFRRGPGLRQAERVRASEGTYASNPPRRVARTRRAMTVIGTSVP